MLTELNILTITETIDKAEISFSHLRDELIDHVCCEIECQMENGTNFQEAFSTIKSKIGIRELQIVQENTLLLIDKQYRIMKKLMKISGVLSLIFLITGTIFRIFHYPASNILVGLGFLLLCFLFLPMAMSIMRKENKSNTKLFLFLSGYVGIIGFSLGTYFRARYSNPSVHWSSNTIVSIPAYALVYFKENININTRKNSCFDRYCSWKPLFCCTFVQNDALAGSNNPLFYKCSCLNVYFSPALHLYTV